MDSVGRVGDVSWQEDAHKQIKQHIDVINILLSKPDKQLKRTQLVLERTKLESINSDIEKGIKLTKDKIKLLNSLDEIDLDQGNISFLKQITDSNVSNIAHTLDKPVLEFLCGDYSCDKIPEDEVEIIDYHKGLEKTAEETLHIFRKLFQLQNSKDGPTQATKSLILEGTQLKDQDKLDAWCKGAREYLSLSKQPTRRRAEAVDASDLSKYVKNNEKVTSEPEEPASQNLRLDRLKLQLDVINDVEKLLDEALEQVAEDKQESILGKLDNIERHKSILDDLWDSKNISNTDWKEKVDKACSNASTLLNNVHEFLEDLKAN